MKLLAPIREFDELEMLLASGAEELYCGVAPREWMERFQGPAWLHRRAAKGSSFESLEEVRRLTDAAHAAGVPVFATFNAPSYTPEQLPLVLDLADRLSEECGLDALIVSDVSLMLEWAERRRNAVLHVSSVAATLNVEAVRFLLDFGARRVILPRSVTLREIAAITAAIGNAAEIEVFLMNDGCAFEEGFCATTHHHAVGAFCTSLSSMRTDVHWKGRFYSARRRRWLLQNHADYHRWIWYLNGNGGSTTAKGLPYGPCGLCAIPDLQRAGVASLKIVGREASPFRKMASVRMAADVLRRQREEAPRSSVLARARSLRGEAEAHHCDAGYMCYYQVPNGDAEQSVD
jgi:U32 family peptidase